MCACAGPSSGVDAGGRIDGGDRDAGGRIDGGDRDAGGRIDGGNRDAGDRIDGGGAAIWSTDFSEHSVRWEPASRDGLFHILGGTLADPGANEPAGWTGYKVLTESQGADLAIIPGAGAGGTPAARIRYPHGGVSGAISLVKWLPGPMPNRIWVGWRYRVSENWRWMGDTTAGNYWKMLRVWQDVQPGTIVDGNPTLEPLGDIGRPNAENEKHYAVISYGGSLGWTRSTGGSRWQFFGATFDANTLGNSSGGTRFNIGPIWPPPPTDPLRNSGYVPFLFGDVDIDGHFVSSAPQEWHELEVLLDYNDGPWPSDSGAYELWFDGVQQSLAEPGNPGFQRVDGSGGPVDPYTDHPTAHYGLGPNMFVLNDNAAITGAWDQDSEPGTDTTVTVNHGAAGEALDIELADDWGSLDPGDEAYLIRVDHEGDSLSSPLVSYNPVTRRATGRFGHRAWSPTPGDRVRLYRAKYAYYDYFCVSEEPIFH